MKLKFNLVVTALCSCALLSLAWPLLATGEDAPPPCGYNRRCTIAELPPDKAENFRSLKVKLAGSDSTARTRAALWLCDFATLTTDGILEAQRLLQDPDHTVRVAAAISLFCALDNEDTKSIELKFASSFRLAEKLVLSAFKDPDKLTRGVAYQYSHRLPKKLVIRIIEHVYSGLKELDLEIRHMAMQGIIFIGGYRQFDALSGEYHKMSETHPALTSRDKRRRDALLPLLKDPDPDIRMQLLSFFTELAKIDPIVRSEALNLITDPDSHVRSSVGELLQASGPSSWDLVPKLVEFLRAEDSELRGLALYLLGKLGPDAYGALPAIESALSDPNEGVRHDAEVAIGFINRDPDYLIEKLGGAKLKGDSKLALANRSIIATVGGGRPESVKNIFTAPKRESYEYLFGSCDRCPISSAAIPTLEQQSHSSDADFKECASSLMKGVQPEPVTYEMKETIRDEDLARDVASPDISTRASAIEAIARIKKGTQYAADVLTSGLSDPIVGIRMQSAWAAGAYEIGGPDVIKKLKEALSDKAPGVRLQAAWALLQLKEPAPEILNVVFQSLKGGPYCIGGAEAVSLLREPLLFRPEVANALGVALESDCGCVTAEAARAVVAIGAKAEPVIDSLLKRLGDTDICSRNSNSSWQEIAADTGPESASLLFPEGGQCQNYVSNGWVVAWALGRLNRVIPSVTEQLIVTLSDPNPRRRAQAAFALGVAGPAAKSAIEPLTKITNDSSPFVRRASQEALRLIQSQVNPIDRYVAQCGDIKNWANNWLLRWEEELDDGQHSVCCIEPIVGPAELGWGWFRSERPVS